MNILFVYVQILYKCMYIYIYIHTYIYMYSLVQFLINMKQICLILIGCYSKVRVKLFNNK